MAADGSYHGGAGEAFAAKANAPGLNSLHERPAVLELIGDVDGQRIADLGCGAGNYLVELARRGALRSGPASPHGPPRFLAEVHRILRPGGWFVVSSTHPTADWGRFGGSYFDQRWVTRPLDDQHSITYQLVPLSILVNELLDSGFVLDTMIEPQPLPELEQADPQRYEELRAAPIFLTLRLHT